ncbi:MAG: tRNA dihydrouridine synthase [Phycisphaerales bacterium]
MLAPIAGWCELAWRVSVRQLNGPTGGVGLACTDLLNSQGLLCDEGASRDLARTNELDRPIGMQLYGADPEHLAAGARWCAQHGASVVDINMGCPVDKICKKNGGSKLMCDLASTYEIFEAVREALPNTIPLTAKMRLGWDQEAYEDGVACELAVGLCERGAACITVHGRTTEQKFKGSCDHDGIKKVVDAVRSATGQYNGTESGGIPVLGNGDVKSALDVITMRRNTGCAGVMIGRGAFGNPWIFRLGWALQQRIETQGIELDDHETIAAIDLSDLAPSEDEKLELVRNYFLRMIEYRDEKHALHVIRQKISWLGRTINDGHCRDLKEGVRKSKTVEEVLYAIESWRDQTHAVGECS